MLKLCETIAHNLTGSHCSDLFFLMLLLLLLYCFLLLHLYLLLYCEVGCFIFSPPQPPSVSSSVYFINTHLALCIIYILLFISLICASCDLFCFLLRISRLYKKLFLFTINNDSNMSFGNVRTFLVYSHLCANFCLTYLSINGLLHVLWRQFSWLRACVFQEVKRSLKITVNL